MSAEKNEGSAWEIRREGMSHSIDRQVNSAERGAVDEASRQKMADFQNPVATEEEEISQLVHLAFRRTKKISIDDTKAVFRMIYRRSEPLMKAFARCAILFA